MKYIFIIIGLIFLLIIKVLRLIIGYILFVIWTFNINPQWYWLDTNSSYYPSNGNTWKFTDEIEAEYTGLFWVFRDVFYKFGYNLYNNDGKYKIEKLPF